MVVSMLAHHVYAESLPVVEDSVQLEPVVVTASHTPKSLKDVPVVTRLISRQDIRMADATNIQDLLTQMIPGLEFGFAMTQETSLHMSGFGGNAILFLVDGERMAGETMDNVDYNRMNLDNVGRIEMVKGASSALYGSNAVGGVVNIISRENLEPWTANANTRFSTFGQEWRNGVNFSFNKAKWNSQTSFQHTKIDPVDLPKPHSSEEIAIELMKKAQGLPYDESVFEDNSDISRLHGQKTYNVKQRLTWRASDRLTITGRGGYFFRTSERDTHDYHFNGYSAGMKGRYAWEQDRELELSYAFDQYDKANFLPSGARTHDHDYTNRQHVAHALFTQSLGRNSLLLGADYMSDYLTTYQFLDNTSHRQDNIDGYAQFDWNITDQLNVVGSIRYDYFSASSNKALTERLALVYKLPWMTLRANYASGFRAPTLKEMYMHFDMGNMGYMLIGNPELEPEKSHNFNVAIDRTQRIRKGGVLDGSYSVMLMGYCNLFDKRITTIGHPYEDLPGALYVNEDGVNVWGVDLCLGYVMDCGLSLRYNYSWLHETGNVIFSQFSQPRSHSMTWSMAYAHRFSRHYALDAAISGRSLGKPQSGDTDVDQGYTIWKLMLQHHLWRGIHLNTAIDNIFNFKPRAYYFSSPLTTGTAVSVGLSVDIDRLCP